MILLSNEEAAEQYANEYGDFTILSDWDIANNSFLAGCEHVEKRDREFYLLVRDYFNENDLYYLDSVHRKNVDRISNEIKKHLAAFTEREQQNLPKQ